MTSSVTSAHTIITGGSSGIGLAIAQHLVAQGMRVTLIARDQARLQQAKATLEQIDSEQTTSSSVKQPDKTARQDPPQVLTVSADVSDRAQATQAIQSAIAQFGPPSQLITSAGIAQPGHFEQLSVDVFEEAMAVNYFGTLYCIQAVLPAMQQQGYGKIALISSGAGLIGLYGYSAYGASKFAVRGLAESLRAEFKPMNISVSIAYPPDTDTPQLTAENLTKPAATKQITATASLWSAEAVAQKIVQGMAKGQFEISPGHEISILTRMHSLISPLLNRYFDRIVARSKA
ncbi:MAG: SDR family oxidoreductase [Cyanobacteria bacterium J06634_5]